MIKCLRCLAVATALCLPATLRAQDDVTATSGDPRAIERVRSQYQATESRLARLRVDSLALEGFSAEGGELVAYWDGDDILKVVAHHYGETFRSREEFYYASDRVYFIHVVTEEYTEPLSGVVAGTLENRFYYANGRLIRRVRTQHPPKEDRDMTDRDPDPTAIRQDATRFRGCAVARRDGADTCFPDA